MLVRPSEWYEWLCKVIDRVFSIKFNEINFYVLKNISFA